jgi:hypothetical protein
MVLEGRWKYVSLRVGAGLVMTSSPGGIFSMSLQKLITRVRQYRVSVQKYPYIVPCIGFLFYIKIS